MSSDDTIRRIAIVGGGTAGWMAASVLARGLPNSKTEITVIESPAIGTVGVGEATIPPIIDLLRFLNINEADFIRHTRATFKLGIQFQDWRQPGTRYWHPFGAFGAPLNLRPFFHSWQRARAGGQNLKIRDFSLCAALGEEDKFSFPSTSPESPASGLRYALHFDAALVAGYLRTYAERLGVERRASTVKGTTLRDDGFIDALVFDDGSRLQADLFVDCSGFRGLLIEEALHTGYVDWSDSLPCDRAVTLPSARGPKSAPYTRSQARAAGWQWRIPLRHRVGNGYVYSSAHVSDDAAHADLRAQLGTQPIGDPTFLRFTTGRRKLFWNRNCVALGLASGFLEPLESTSIHLVMSGVYKLLEHFPDANFARANIDSYNRELIAEIEGIRDFIVAHYCLTARTDTAFWNDCRAVGRSSQLQARIELYEQCGRIRHKAGDLFTDLSWFYIFDGMGLVPRRHDPLIDLVDPPIFHGFLAEMSQATARTAAAARTHDSYLGEFER